MNPGFAFFVVAMLTTCSLAILYGGRDERLGAIALATASIVTTILSASSYGNAERFSGGAELGMMLVDIALFFALAAIAMRSRAFWPMWAAGFHLCALAVHVVAATSPHMLPAVYAESLALWSYPVIAALGFGTWFEARMSHGRS